MKATARQRIRFDVSTEEHDRIRVSAALSRTTMADFCRQIVVKHASEATKDIMPPGTSTTRKSARK